MAASDPALTPPRIGADVVTLLRLLQLAFHDAAVPDADLHAFARAFAERADALLGERQRQAEDEASLYRKAIATLEARVEWQEETISGLQARATWQEETIAGLEERARALASQAVDAAEAHDRLRDHHREALSRIAAELRGLGSLSPLRFRQMRRVVAELVALLDAETT